MKGNFHSPLNVNVLTVIMGTCPDLKASNRLGGRDHPVKELLLPYFKMQDTYPRWVVKDDLCLLLFLLGSEDWLDDFSVEEVLRCLSAEKPVESDTFTFLGEHIVLSLDACLDEGLERFADKETFEPVGW